MPVKDVAHAIIKEVGFDGWVSMELFNRVMNRTDRGVVDELASRAAGAWDRLVSDLQLHSEVAHNHKCLVRESLRNIQISRL